MCPNCGADDDHLYLKSGYSGDGFNDERFWEEWLECDECGAATTPGELRMLYEDEF